LTVFATTLVACGQPSTSNKTTTSSTLEVGKVELVVKEDTNVLSEKVVYHKGDTVLDVLKANYKVKEKDGFITSIDGISQDETKGLYWMFKVNNKLAPKAANQIKVKKNDKIEFYQEVYKK
ncbi:DUF4430 domain-containing protein, partial [Streptococcus sp. SPC0]|nr:DUF4430 domain-containing protein [Streptococcus sp. SPC0]